VSVITGIRGRANTLSSSRPRYRATRGGGLLLVVAFAGPACTLTAEGFEPDPVGSPETETRGLTGSQPPPAPPQTPAGSTTAPSQTPAEGIDPTAALEPTNIGNESVGGETSNIIAGADAGVAPSEAAEPNTPDAGAPAPPDAGATPLDASTATAS
jgi:hypothetical protein